MKRDLSSLSAVAVAWIAIVVTPSVVTAETTQFGVTPRQNVVRESNRRLPLFDVTLESSFATVGKATFRGSDFGDSDACNVSLGPRTRARLNQHWSFPLELRSQNLSLSSLAGVTAPEDIHTLQFGAGLNYRPNDHWSSRVGADLNMVTFRTDDSLGTSVVLPQYNDALGTYRDIRIGAGVTHRISKTPSVKANLGYPVNRQIDCAGTDDRVELIPLPEWVLPSA